MAQRSQPASVPVATVTRRGTARVLAVASGKGGVGKTNVVVNLATRLAQMNQRVLVLDADLGLANVDVLMGIQPAHNLLQAIYGQLPLSEVIYHAGPNLQILAGASGVDGLADLPDSQRETLLQRLGYLEEQYDFLIIDCGAGVDHNVLGFTCASNEVLVVCTPEPPAVMDAYSLIKLIHRKGASPRISLVMNMVDRPSDGQNAAETIMDVSERFLGIRIDTVHYIPRDPLVSQAVRRGRPLIEVSPGGPAGLAPSRSWRAPLPDPRPRPSPRSDSSSAWDGCWASRAILKFAQPGSN